ncbi:TetR/AcrR family transcriptional regulator [Nonomuraea sp. NPDC059007]|uniref:TetR/AcrR family transcriptional regulator n=1 Tax=Nonomuraea sp. NPDC059007 TaxID=3346692 RepID=UPI0036AD4CAE
MVRRDDMRERIIAAAADLLAAEGQEAVTTRSVSAAAGVQPPAIYRLFGDMQGLLDTVAADGFARYLAEKKDRAPSADPIDDLRAGWDLHVEFGLRHPAHYRLMYQQHGADEAARQAQEILRGILRRAAAAGLLRVPVERAAQMVHASSMGVTLTLISLPPGERDLTLSAALRESVLAALTVNEPGGPERDPVRHAVALRALLGEMEGGFTPGERALLGELLDRFGEPA